MKAFRILKREGVQELLKKIFLRLKSIVNSRKRNKIDAKKLDNILENNKDKKIIIFPPIVDWGIPLFQRPQHMAKRFAEYGYLYFYCTPNSKYDQIYGFKEIYKNCFITNRFDLLKKTKRKKIIHLYSTDMKPIDSFINESINSGSLILYEYVDEIHEDIFGSVPDYVLKRHNKLLADERCIVVATADKLFQSVLKYRSINCALITNGVDYDHFSKHFNINEMPELIKNIKSSNKPIIGYFGALAKWFDYKLIEFIAETNKYEILLIGCKYDESIADYNFERYKNVSIIGPIDYNELPKYGYWFDVSIIPFKINEITESTSPIKLFEYMALGHPIVTTNIPESKKYKSVIIGKDYEDFAVKLDEALHLKSDVNYRKIINKEALNNTWESKAKQISNLIEWYKKSITTNTTLAESKKY